ENYQVETSFRSDDLIFGAFFSMGVRVYDITKNPFHPDEVGYYVPPTPPGSRLDAIQMNDVYVDENRLFYAMDRITGGVYILELSSATWAAPRCGVGRLGGHHPPRQRGGHHWPCAASRHTGGVNCGTQYPVWRGCVREHGSPACCACSGGSTATSHGAAYDDVL